MKVPSASQVGSRLLYRVDEMAHLDDTRRNIERTSGRQGDNKRDSIYYRVIFSRYLIPKNRQTICDRIKEKRQRQESSIFLAFYPDKILGFS